jgi:hypothetical protein
VPRGFVERCRKRLLTCGGRRAGAARRDLTSGVQERWRRPNDVALAQLWETKRPCGCQGLTVGRAKCSLTLRFTFSYRANRFINDLLPHLLHPGATFSPG